MLRGVDVGRRISRFSMMVRALGSWLSEIDVNPLIVHAEGAVCVDALVIAAAPSDSSNHEAQKR